MWSAAPPGSSRATSSRAPSTTLFVDEAGQVGLANLVAMGRAARNIVLVGDPRQLPQVIQGAHPEPANLSCLDWMLGDHATSIPTGASSCPKRRGCIPTSAASSRTRSTRAGCTPTRPPRGSASSAATAAAGAFLVPVAHEGNAQVCPEEVAAIRGAVERLLAGSWTDRDGSTRPHAPGDIIVVAPYNAQVNALRTRCPTSASAPSTSSRGRRRRSASSR